MIAGHVTIIGAKERGTEKSLRQAWLRGLPLACGGRVSQRCSRTHLYRDNASISEEVRGRVWGTLRLCGPKGAVLKCWAGPDTVVRRELAEMGWWHSGLWKILRVFNRG